MKLDVELTGLAAGTALGATALVGVLMAHGWPPGPATILAAVLYLAAVASGIILGRSSVPRPMKRYTLSDEHKRTTLKACGWRCETDGAGREHWYAPDSDLGRSLASAWDYWRSTP